MDRQNLFTIAQGGHVNGTDQPNTYLMPFPVQIFLRYPLSSIRELQAHAGKGCWSQSSMIQKLGWPDLDPWSSPQLQLTPAADNHQSKFSKVHIDFLVIMTWWLSAAKELTQCACSRHNGMTSAGISSVLWAFILKNWKSKLFPWRENQTKQTKPLTKDL